MTSERATCTATRWLSIVGIGEDGTDGLSPVAQKLIATAELVVGGKVNRVVEISAAAAAAG